RELRGRRIDIRVVAIKYGDIGSLLVLKNPKLRLTVRAKVRITIEMGGSDIQQRGDFGTKINDGVELKAADFDDVDGVGGRRIDQVAHGRPDVASHRDGPAGGFEDPAYQRRRRGFSIRSGDPDD